MGFNQMLTAWIALAVPQVIASLTGSGTITYHDYQSLPLSALQYNPPACGMPYAQLDMTRITAVQQIDTTSECGQCIKVCNANDPSKFVYVLAVDKGGRGLDLSKPSFGKLFNIDDGVGPAQWFPVDNSNCAGIWSNGGGGAFDGSQVPAPAPEPAPQPVPQPAPQPAPQPVPQPAPEPAPQPISSSSTQPPEPATSSAPLPPTIPQPSSTVAQTSDSQPIVERSTLDRQPQVPIPPITSEEPAPSTEIPSEETTSEDSSESSSEYAVNMAHDAQSESSSLASESTDPEAEDLADLDTSETSSASTVSLTVFSILAAALIF